MEAEIGLQDVHARESTGKVQPRIVVLLALVVVMGGIGATKLALGRTEDRVIARADEFTLKQSEVEELIAQFDAATRERILQDASGISALVRRELGRRLLQQQALAEGWDRRDDVKARLERLRLDFVTTSYLEAKATPPESFPSEAEIDTAYQLNQQRFLMPRQFHLAQVYVRRPAESGLVDSARATAKAVAAELRKDPERLAEVARAKSADTASASRGGDLGWLPEDQIQPVIRAVAIGLARGEVSEAVETADGWHILRLIETRPAAVAPLSQVREALSATLRQQRAQENAAAYVSKLISEKKAAVDEIALGEALKEMH